MTHFNIFISISKLGHIFGLRRLIISYPPGSPPTQPGIKEGPTHPVKYVLFIINPQHKKGYLPLLALLKNTNIEQMSPE